MVVSVELRVNYACEIGGPYSNPQVIHRLLEKAKMTINKSHAGSVYTHESVCSCPGGIFQDGLLEDLAGVHGVDPDDVQLLSHGIPAAPVVYGLISGIHQCREHGSPIVVDGAGSNQHIPGGGEGGALVILLARKQTSLFLLTWG